MLLSFNLIFVFFFASSFLMRKNKEDNFCKFVGSMRRSRHDIFFGGVCKGMEEITDAPALLWRFLFLVSSISFGVGILVYVIFWILVEEK